MTDTKAVSRAYKKLVLEESRLEVLTRQLFEELSLKEDELRLTQMKMASLRDWYDALFNCPSCIGLSEKYGSPCVECRESEVVA